MEFVDRNGARVEWSTESKFYPFLSTKYDTVSSLSNVCHLWTPERFGNAFRSLELIFIHRTDFLSTESNFYPQNYHTIFSHYISFTKYLLSIYPGLGWHQRFGNVIAELRTYFYPQALFLSTTLNFYPQNHVKKNKKNNVNWKNSIAGNKNPQGACDEPRAWWHSQIGETWISGP